MELLAEINPMLPAVRIDMFNCRNLKSSLELAPTKIVNRNGKKLVVKEKKSEQLPSQSTNFSDAFKYLLCRKTWMKYVKGIRSQSAGDLSTYAG
jgi:hypothetical protein